MNTYYVRKSVQNLSADFAYAVTYNLDTAQELIEQHAIWRLQGMTDSSVQSFERDGNMQPGKEVAQQAKAYSEFDAKEKYFKDETNYNSTVVEVDYSSQEYIIGPFKLDYVSGITDCNVVLGGITDLYLKGDTGERLDIVEFRIKNSKEKYAPEFWDPIRDSNINYGIQIGDEETQKYPKPNEEFYIVINKPQTDVKKVHIEGTYEYLKAKGTVIEYTGYNYTVTVTYYGPKYDEDGNKIPYSNGYYEYSEGILSAIAAQNTWEVVSDTGREIKKIDLEQKEDNEISITMELGGYVWEEILEDLKDADLDGIKNGADIFKKGVEVTLRYGDDGINGAKDSVVTINGVEQIIVTSDKGRSISLGGKPYNLKAGQYLFKNLDSLRKYYIEFIYNGQIYQHTLYTNSSRIRSANGIKSYGTETENLRDSLNALFAEIASNPMSYSGGKVYAWKDAVNEQIKSSEMTEEDWLKALYEKFEDAAVKANSFEEAYKVLGETEKYVIDCLIAATTGNNPGESSASQLYPQVDKFVIWRDGTDEDAELISKPGIRDNSIESEYRKIDCYIYNENYNDLRHIDFGITKREEADLAIQKDVYEATITIKGNTQTYKYNKRQAISEDKTWDIKDKLESGYYNSSYTREIYKEDFSYKSDFYKVGHFYDKNGNIVDEEARKAIEEQEANLDSELEVYLTYKVSIKNQSSTIDVDLTELVDYYDEDLSLVISRPDVSNTNNGNPIPATYIGDSKGNPINLNIGYSPDSRYSGTESSIQGYKKLYIQIPSGNELKASQTMYLYLTFRVNKNEQRFVLLDEAIDQITEDSPGKENIIEINGYISNYGDAAKAPNTNGEGYTEYEAGDFAGLVDIDSVPGNIPTNIISSIINSQKQEGITTDVISKEIAEFFEDDTDKAPNIRIILNGEHEREINGTVWEDARTLSEQLAQIGNGIKEDGETAVNGVVVQLVEYFTVNGEQYEYIWREMLSGDNSRTFYPVVGIEGVDSLNKTYSLSEDAFGKYKFASFVPGNYFVRFIYGNGTSSVLGVDSTDYKTGATITNPVLEALVNYTENGIDGFKENNDIVKIIKENDVYKAQYKYSECYLDYLEENPDNRVKARSETSIITLNKDSYNGQDFKSTLYQSGLNTYNANNKNENTSKGYEYKFATVDSSDTNYSDVKDMWNRRNVVINYSKENVTNAIAEVLSSAERITTGLTSSDKAEILEKLRELMTNTAMVAESGTMNIEIEYDRDYSGTTQDGKNNIDTSNKTGTIQRDENGNIIKEDSKGQYTENIGGYYKVENVDLGLQERAKSQIKTNKQVANVKVILANGSTLFDAVEKATNVMWITGSAHGADIKNEYTINTNYDNNMMKIPSVRGYKNSTIVNDGYIQLTMDKELMHGAIIKVTYLITVANVGEVDYIGETFYYTGEIENDGIIVTTNAEQLIDYVGYQGTSDPNAKNNVTRNNLTFTQSENSDWEVIDIEESNLLNQALLENATQYNTIITTEAVAGELIPVIADEDNAKQVNKAIKDSPLNAVETINKTNSIRGVYLSLSQTLKVDGDGDDKSYNNMVELVKSSNTVGRRMNYSVVGNQNPIEDPAEIDSDDAEPITILPPFGNTHIYYYLIGGVTLILLVGITLIIKFVVKKKI